LSPIPSRFNHYMKDWQYRQMWLFALCQEHSTDINYQCWLHWHPIKTNKVVDRLSHGSGSHSGKEKGSSTDILLYDRLWLMKLKQAKNGDTVHDDCDPRFDMDAVLVVFWSSGTTGRPKGIMHSAKYMVSHHRYLHTTLWRCVPMSTFRFVDKMLKMRKCWLHLIPPDSTP
jgi:acyl-CoA synthetase (AMP-forming)/AMP-acid ligase II